jgi:uncharacterized protein YkwD
MRLVSMATALILGGAGCSPLPGAVGQVGGGNLPGLGGVVAGSLLLGPLEQGDEWLVSDDRGPESLPLARAPARFSDTLAAHNKLRAKHCAPPLTWSAEVASVASGWARRLRDKDCAFKHNPRTPYGENLSFFSPVGLLDGPGVVRDWYDEVSMYDFSRPGFDMRTGHFTQVVWKDTRRLGCGAALCGGGEVWVCSYSPPGNYRGDFEQNVLPANCRK